ncbi:Lysine-epsilon oxidase [Enhygromyxa salina]|uniref:Lysine-epsilon oxidase n=1 Tax=Enhygromyxa salina TaxID=215803 RepID=A0A0C2CQ17_9BACT|nr:LodA/GoxA family CTQ-dependent oxidase [Enhygromyxa salina]KIG13271.1 Lysine-epsilon oxidase [Enhygromyxa salina]
MSKTSFRIHPSIGFARVGTAETFYLAPESLAGLPLSHSGVPPSGAHEQLTGGLPIRAGTEDTPITASDLRGPDGGLARQAARFRVYAYSGEDDGGSERYPMSKGPHKQVCEIVVGSEIEIAGHRKTVTEILWTVHVANKKTAWYESADDDGILAWGETKDPKVPCDKNGTALLRNRFLCDDPHDPRRLRTLIIDPGPRVIAGTSKAAIGLDDSSDPSCVEVGVEAGVGGGLRASVKNLCDYPKSFPKQSVAQIPKIFAEGEDYDGKLYPPGVQAIRSLGELRTDAHGRLLVVAAWGRANSFNKRPAQYGMTHSVNNDWWFDDTGDGPVNAVLKFHDGSAHVVEGAAWVVSTDPAYAPQIPNVVSLWDDIYDTWIHDLNLRPDLYIPKKVDKHDKNKKLDKHDNGKELDPDYRPCFDDEIRPIFLAAGLQRWVVNLNPKGIAAHSDIAKLGPKSDDWRRIFGIDTIRKPVVPDGEHVPAVGDRKRMPLALGDARRPLLSLTRTQYHFLARGFAGRVREARVPLGPGELLDKASLFACLGGRFGPGIDMSYPCRESNMWMRNWSKSGGGPFRVRARALDYTGCSAGQPFLSLGWTPRRRNPFGLEPGDVSKFMAIPWHADYNSCGTHIVRPNKMHPEDGEIVDPNSEPNNQLYWSWPAQRPVAVYVAKDVGGRKTLDEVAQRFSIRGPGTKTEDLDPAKPTAPGNPGNPAEVGRYQKTPRGKQDSDPGILRFLDNWMKIGVVIQATNIDDGGEYEPDHYLEVQSQLADEPSDSVQAWDKGKVPPGRYDA